MAHAREVRRRDVCTAELQTEELVWITVIGPVPAGFDGSARSGGFGGTAFHDCPICRELALAAGTAGAAVPDSAILEFRPVSLPELARAGWIDDIVELVGRNATVRVMGRDMEAEPVEVLSMDEFLERVGYA